MQLAAISTISRCNTIKSLDNCIIQRDNPYWTVAFDDVVTAMGREIVLLKEKKDLEAKFQVERENIKRLDLVIKNKNDYIAILEKEYKDLEDKLAKAVELLKIGKEEFAPHTTNSDVDLFIKENKKGE